MNEGARATSKGRRSDRSTNESESSGDELAAAASTSRCNVIRWGAESCFWMTKRMSGRRTRKPTRPAQSVHGTSARDRSTELVRGCTCSQMQSCRIQNRKRRSSFVAVSAYRVLSATSGTRQGLEQQDVARRHCIPAGLKVLCALHVLGRGNCFDDVAQLSYMSESTAVDSFHTFCYLFAEELYDEFIKWPEAEAMNRVRQEYHELRFTGAVGSTDVTHISWACTPHSLRRSYTGTEGFPTIAYQATVTRSRYAIGITEGFPGAQNDKMNIRHDLTVQTVRESQWYRGMEYKKKVNGEDEIGHGAYLIVDGGYHKWACLINPSKHCMDEWELLFSKRHEQVRKDVECFFGVLKGRFRLLTLPILFGEKKRIDNVFFTCCILHNMLHMFDWLDALEKDVDWTGADGLHDPHLHDATKDVSSGGSKTCEDVVEVELGHAELKKKLIASFIYRSKVGDIHWLMYTPCAP